MTSQTPAIRQPDRLAALGGLAFVVTVVIENVVQGAVAPAGDASTTTVIDAYVDGRASFQFGAIAFVLAAFALAVFTGGLWRRLDAGAADLWTRVGVLGAAGIFALFAANVALELALLTASNDASPDRSAVGTLFLLQKANFGLLSVALGIATLGLSLAAWRQVLLPAVFRIIGPGAAACSALGAAATSSAVDGNQGPLSLLGLVGFLAWLAVVVAISVGLLRTDSAADPAAEDAASVSPAPA